MDEYNKQKQKNLIEELKKANKYTQISISLKMIEMIESALGISHDYDNKEANILCNKSEIPKVIENIEIDIKKGLKNTFEKKHEHIVRSDNEVLILEENCDIINLIMLYGWEQIDCEEALLYAYRIEESLRGICTCVFVLTGHTYPL